MVVFSYRFLFIREIVIFIFVSLRYISANKELYIDQNHPNCGDDFTRAENSNSSPWCSIESLGVSNPKHLELGDTIFVRQGIYNEKLFFRAPKFSEQDSDDPDRKYLSIRGYPGEKPIIRPGFLLSGSWVRDGAFWAVYLDSSVFTNYEHVNLIKREGFGIFRLNSFAELTNHPALIDESDLYYLDESTGKITLLLSGNSSEDPNTDVFVVDATRRIVIFSPFVEIRNFIIEYASSGILPTYDMVDGFEKGANYFKAVDLEFRYIAVQGIISKQEYLLVDNCSFYKIGKPFKYSGTEIQVNNLDHALYLMGSHYLIQNNQMRECCGCCMHPYTPDNLGNSQDLYYPDDISMINNTIFGGACLWGNRLYFKNNIVDTYVSVLATNSIIKNNIISSTATVVTFPYFRPRFNITFTNNIVMGGGNSYCLILFDTDFESSEFDNNLYADCAYFAVGYLDDRSEFVFESFESYKGHMIGEYDKESKSLYQVKKTSLSNPAMSNPRINNSPTVLAY